MPKGIYKRTKKHNDNISKGLMGKTKGIKFTKKHCKSLSKARQILLKKQGYLNSPKTIKKHIKSIKITNDKKRKLYNGYAQPPEQREKISANNIKRALHGLGSWGYKGDFFSMKNNCLIHYTSSGEYGFYMALEYLDDVIKYEVQPFGIKYWFNNSFHHYMPDVLVYFKDRTKQLIEIKPAFLLKDKQVIAKAKAAIQYCNENNMEYKFYTENGFIN